MAVECFIPRVVPGIADVADACSCSWLHPYSRHHRAARRVPAVLFARLLPNLIIRESWPARGRCPKSPHHLCLATHAHTSAFGTHVLTLLQHLPTCEACATEAHVACYRCPISRALLNKAGALPQLLAHVWRLVARTAEVAWRYRLASWHTSLSMV